MNTDINFFDFLYTLVTKFINVETILSLGASSGHTKHNKNY